MLGINFDEVYKRTNKSYKPDAEGRSDYKSASSVERIEAFIKLGRPDPIAYADETGAVEWEEAKIYVEQVISEAKVNAVSVASIPLGRDSDSARSTTLAPLACEIRSMTSARLTCVNPVSMSVYINLASAAPSCDPAAAGMHTIRTRTHADRRVVVMSLAP